MKLLVNGDRAARIAVRVCEELGCCSGSYRVSGKNRHYWVECHHLTAKGEQLLLEYFAAFVPGSLLRVEEAIYKAKSAQKARKAA